MRFRPNWVIRWVDCTQSLSWLFTTSTWETGASEMHGHAGNEKEEGEKKGTAVKSARINLIDSLSEQQPMKTSPASFSRETLAVPFFPTHGCAPCSLHSPDWLFVKVGPAYKAIEFHYIQLLIHPLKKQAPWNVTSRPCPVKRCPRGVSGGPHSLVRIWKRTTKESENQTKQAVICLFQESSSTRC